MVGEECSPVSNTIRTSVATTLMPVGSYTANSWLASTVTHAAAAAARRRPVGR